MELEELWETTLAEATQARDFGKFVAQLRPEVCNPDPLLDPITWRWAVGAEEGCEERWLCEFDSSPAFFWRGVNTSDGDFGCEGGVGGAVRSELSCDCSD